MIETVQDGAARVRRKSPGLARAISIVPGLGQLYYGAPVRAAQYLAGVVLSFAGALLVYDLSFELARLGVNPILTSIGFLVSELVALALVVSAISFWIDASWDARQGVVAHNEGRTYQPTWWYVKVRRFLFADPDEEATGE